jgi:AcrR family transcriptional regulator
VDVKKLGNIQTSAAGATWGPEPSLVSEQTFRYGGAMGRPAKYDEQILLAAARDVVATRGVAGLTFRALSLASGVPLASVARRFPNREALLARAWLASASLLNAEITTAGSGEGAAAARTAAVACSLLSFSATHPSDVRLLAAIPRHALIDAFDADIAEALALADAPLLGLIGGLARALVSERGLPREAVRAGAEAVTRCVVDLPWGLLHRYLDRLPELPNDLCDVLTACVLAVLETSHYA